ncbi:type IV pilin protein [Candidatus Avelusimicrobium sp.]
MKKLSEAKLKLLKHKNSSPCVPDKNREDAKQKHFSMTHGFAKGFTLIELLVVVLIIGILSAVALPQYRAAVLKSRTTQGMITLNAIDKAQQEYKLANGDYTTDLDNLSVQFKPGSVGCYPVSGGNTLYCQIRISADLLMEIDPAPIGDIKRRCLAKTDSSAANRACKSFGGRNYENDRGGYNYYTMP